MSTYKIPLEKVEVRTPVASNAAIEQGESLQTADDFKNNQSFMLLYKGTAI